MNVGSLFTGIGGLDLAIPGQHAWMCEYDPHCRAVLEQRFPGVPIYEDVRELGADTPAVDILVGGYPCQPFSVAGLRKGEDDPRHLWPHFARLIRLLRPRVVVAENVAGHLRLGFHTVLADLAELGMDVRWGTVRASDVGAPHNRARLFIVATDTDVPRPQGIREQPGTASRQAPTDGDRAPTEPDWGVYEPAVRQWEHLTGTRAPRPTDTRGRLNPVFVEWMMGLPAGWTDGQSRTARLRMLGNAVVPQQAELALSLLAQSPDRGVS